MKKSLLSSLTGIILSLILTTDLSAWDGGNSLSDLIEKIGMEAHKMVPADDVPCDAHAKAFIKRYLNAYHGSDYIQSRFVEAGNLLETINEKARARGEDPPIDRGWYKTAADKVFASYAATADYTSFVRMLTGKDLGGLTDPKRVRALYDQLTDMEKKFKSVAMMPIMHEDGCYGISQIIIGTQKLSYPHIQWAGYISFTSKCKCKDQDETKAKEIEYVVQFTVRSGLVSAEIKKKEGDKEIVQTHVVPSYDDPRNFRVRTYKVQCCPDKDKEEEDASYSDPFENGEISMPDEVDYFIDYFVDEMMSGELSPEEEDELFDQFISMSMGIGYSRNEDEVGFCTGFGYHHKVLDLLKASLFVGGDALVDFGKQGKGDSKFKATVFMFGPKAEMYIPLKSDVVALKAGLGGGFGYGVQKIGEQKDNFTMGYLDVLVGLYLQCKAIAFCLETPLFQFQRFKFRDDFGDYTDSNIGVNLNKSTPLKASIFLPLGRE